MNAVTDTKAAKAGHTKAEVPTAPVKAKSREAELFDAYITASDAFSDGHEDRYSEYEATFKQAIADLVSVKPTNWDGMLHKLALLGLEAKELSPSQTSSIIDETKHMFVLSIVALTETTIPVEQIDIEKAFISLAAKLYMQFESPETDDAMLAYRIFGALEPENIGIKCNINAAWAFVQAGISDWVFPHLEGAQAFIGLIRESTAEYRAEAAAEKAAEAAKKAEEDREQGRMEYTASQQLILARAKALRQHIATLADKVTERAEKDPVFGLMDTYIDAFCHLHAELSFDDWEDETKIWKTADDKERTAYAQARDCPPTTTEGQAALVLWFAFLDRDIEYDGHAEAIEILLEVALSEMLGVQGFKRSSLLHYKSDAPAGIAHFLKPDPNYPGMFSTKPNKQEAVLVAEAPAKAVQEQAGGASLYEGKGQALMRYVNKLQDDALPDPIFGAIENHVSAFVAYFSRSGTIEDEETSEYQAAKEREDSTFDEVEETSPSTPEGHLAKAAWWSFHDHEGGCGEQMVLSYRDAMDTLSNMVGVDAPDFMSFSIAHHTDGTPRYPDALH